MSFEILAVETPQKVPKRCQRLLEVSAGIFGADESGAGSVRVEDIEPVGEIQAWAVTIEPRGGVPQPTGAMVLRG